MGKIVIDFPILGLKEIKHILESNLINAKIRAESIKTIHRVEERTIFIFPPDWNITATFTSQGETNYTITKDKYEIKLTYCTEYYYKIDLSDSIEQEVA